MYKEGSPQGRKMCAAGTKLRAVQPARHTPGTAGRVRILIVAYTDYAYDARVRRHAEALAQRGWAIDVMCLVPRCAIEQSAVRLIGIPAPRYRGHSRIRYLGNYLRFFAAAAWSTARLHFKQPYHAVIACSIPDAAVLCGLVPRLAGSRLALDIHDTMPELYRDKFPGTLGLVGAAAMRFEERSSARLADMVFAVHEPHAQRLCEAGIPRKKIAVVLNTPDPQLFRRVDGQTEKPGDEFTVVTHGTINRRLGLDTALEAINLVRGRIPALKFRIIGPGEHRTSVEQHARRLHLDGLVQFEDGVPLERLAARLRGASVGLVPNEKTAATQLMLPVKLLEYVQLGIPVLVSNLSTIRHYFPEDAVQYFEPGNPQSLAHNLLFLHQHTPRRDALVDGANEVVKGIGWETQRQILFTAVDKLLSGHSDSKNHDGLGL